MPPRQAAKLKPGGLQMVNKCNYSYYFNLELELAKINRTPQTYYPIRSGFNVIDPKHFCEEVTQSDLPQVVNKVPLKGNLNEDLENFFQANFPKDNYTRCLRDAPGLFKIENKIPCLELLIEGGTISCDWGQVYSLKNPVSAGNYFFVDNYYKGRFYSIYNDYGQMNKAVARYGLNQDVRQILCPSSKPISPTCEVYLDAFFKKILEEFLEEYSNIDTNCNSQIDNSENKEQYILANSLHDKAPGEDEILDKPDNFIRFMLKHVLTSQVRLDEDLFVQVATSWDANRNGKITEGDDANLDGKLGVEDASYMGAFAKYLSHKYKLENISPYVASINDWLFFYVQQQGESFLNRINAQIAKGSARNYGYQGTGLQLVDARSNTSVEQKIPVGLSGSETEVFDKEIEYQVFQRDYNEMGTVTTQRNYQIEQENVVKFWAQHTFGIPNAGEVKMMELRTDDEVLLFFDAEAFDKIVVTQEAIRYLRNNQVKDEGPKKIDTELTETSKYDVHSSSLVAVVNLRSNMGILYDTRDNIVLSLFVNDQEPVLYTQANEALYRDQVKKLLDKFELVRNHDSLLRKIFKLSVGYNEGISFHTDSLAQSLKFANNAWQKFVRLGLAQWVADYQVVATSFQNDLSALSAKDPGLNAAFEQKLLQASILLLKISNAPTQIPEASALELKNEITNLVLNQYNGLVNDLLDQLKTARKQGLTKTIPQLKNRLEALSFSIEAWASQDNALTWNNTAGLKAQLKSLHI